MSLFSSFFPKGKSPYTLSVTTPSLQEDILFVVSTIPEHLIKGIEFVENVYDVPMKKHQIHVKATMSAMDIKRKIGQFIHKGKRLKELEDVTKILLASEKIDLDLLSFAYGTDDDDFLFDVLNGDVFAVCFEGNPSDLLTIDIEQAGQSVFMLYLKHHADFRQKQSQNLSGFIDSLFN